MIGSIRGRVLDVTDTELLVEVGGLGYRVNVPPGTLRSIAGAGAEVRLYVYHYYKADVQALYGFATIAERRLFEAMLGANKVGPALAMAIMETHDLASLQQVLANGDVDSLTLVPGIGAKTAQRLLVELQACLDVPGLTSVAPAAYASKGVREDIRDALVEMGFSADSVLRAISELPEDTDGHDEEAMLRLALETLTGDK